MNVQLLVLSDRMTVTECLQLCFLSELYILMRDQDDGVKELKLEQEKRVFNHCFTGSIVLLSVMTVISYYLTSPNGPSLLLHRGDCDRLADF